MIECTYMTLGLNNFNASRVAKLFFLLFLITLFFPIRYVFPTTSSFVTGLYSDFTSISLYLSDIFLFIAFIFTLWSNKFGLFKSLVKDQRLTAIFILWLIVATFILNHPTSTLNIWFFIKLFELIVVSYGTTALLFKNQRPRIKIIFLFVFVSLGTLQSVIGLLQFLNQSPVGLKLLGEQVIYPNLWGIAKIVSNGTAYIRAYGTFPHPNLLSAYLLVTTFINIYLLNSTWKKITQLWLNLALFINILGLIATFSRGAYLAFAVGLIIHFSILVYKQGLKAVFRSALKVVFAILIAFILFKSFLLTRTTISDRATLERGVYNQTAINIIKNKPIGGVGVGESVLHMEQYSPVPLNDWEIQPIHNYFLLSAAELGIVGALLFIWIFISHLKAISYRLKANFDPYYLLLATVLVCFLVLMLFDHYFYTLQQTQMLLWMTLGLIAVETQKNPQEED
jgi:O-antigen ligase